MYVFNEADLERYPLAVLTINNNQTRYGKSDLGKSLARPSTFRSDERGAHNLRTDLNRAARSRPSHKSLVDGRRDAGAEEQKYWFLITPPTPAPTIRPVRRVMATRVYWRITVND